MTIHAERPQRDLLKLLGRHQLTKSDQELTGIDLARAETQTPRIVTVANAVTLGRHIRLSATVCRNLTATFTLLTSLANRLRWRRRTSSKGTS